MPAPKLQKSQIKSTKTVKDGDKTYQRHRGELTPEQREYFAKARAEIEAKVPPKAPTKAVKRPRLEVLLGPDEHDLFLKVDEYIINHNLPNRGAFVRVAIGKLLGIELKIPQRGWVAGRSRTKPDKKPKKKSP